MLVLYSSQDEVRLHVTENPQIMVTLAGWGFILQSGADSGPEHPQGPSQALGHPSLPCQDGSSCWLSGEEGVRMKELFVDSSPCQQPSQVLAHNTACVPLVSQNSAARPYETEGSWDMLINFMDNYTSVKLEGKKQGLESGKN